MKLTFIRAYKLLRSINIQQAYSRTSHLRSNRCHPKTLFHSNARINHWRSIEINVLEDRLGHIFREEVNKTTRSKNDLIRIRRLPSTLFFCCCTASCPLPCASNRRFYFFCGVFYCRITYVSRRRQGTIPTYFPSLRPLVLATQQPVLSRDLPSRFSVCRGPT